MKYYLIAGEASGDLHASNLMKALRNNDPEASFRFFGGDLMAEVGGTLVCHYRNLAYMGFVQVALHASSILQGMKRCKRDIIGWNPDVIILVDYPGFNLKIAKYLREHTTIPIFYYISPKIWAWKTWRIRAIRRDVNEMYSILPFEVSFYALRHCPVHYVGNPCADAVAAYRSNPVKWETFISNNNLDGRPILAILAGSRKAEIKDNLPRMLEAAAAYPDCQPVVAGAPGIDRTFYTPFINAAGDKHVHVIFQQTYPLLEHARAALVTSGTATLETALLHVPQVVCYYIRCGKLISLLRRLFLKVPYISLVNLISNEEVVTELVADSMTVNNIHKELDKLLHDTDERRAMLEKYKKLEKTIGDAGVSANAAKMMIDHLHSYKQQIDK